MLVVVDVTDRSQPPTRVELKLYDRAGGLARDREEPEKTLRELADQAKTSRKGNPDRAFAVAQHVLAVHAALCREAGAPRLRIARTRARVRTSLAAGRAATIAIATLAAQGKLQAALALYQALDTPAYRLLDNDRERARYAMHALVDDRSYAFRSGPLLDLAPGPAGAPRRDRVHRRGSHAAARTDRAQLRPGERRDRAGRHRRRRHASSIRAGASSSAAWCAVARAITCVIANSAQLVAGVVTGPSVAEPLAVRADPPPGAHCPELSAEQKRDDGGIHVLDWSTRGVLLQREQALFLLALDAAGNAGEPARMLGPGDAPPALAHSGALTANGRYLAQLTPLGIAILDRTQGKTRVLAAPDGAGTISDVALSPSGRKLALLRGRQVLIGEPRAAARRPHLPAAMLRIELGAALSIALPPAARARCRRARACPIASATPARSASTRIAMRRSPHARRDAGGRSADARSAAVAPIDPAFMGGPEHRGRSRARVARRRDATRSCSRPAAGCAPRR